jgi:hypothetical protein
LSAHSLALASALHAPEKWRTIVSNLLTRAKARYAQNREAAYRLTGIELPPHVKVDFRVSGWTGKAAEAYAEQWSPVAERQSNDRPAFDWPNLFHICRDPDRLDIVVWGPEETLCGLALGTTTGRSLALRFLEGSPDPNCPLRGRRALIALDVAARYAQLRGKPEIRLYEVDSSLESLYRDIYGFEERRPYKEKPYLWKEV